MEIIESTSSRYVLGRVVTNTLFNTCHETVNILTIITITNLILPTPTMEQELLLVLLCL